MDASLGIVVPAYDPDVDRLASYLWSLQALEPDAVRVELDDPSTEVTERLNDRPATVAVADHRRGKGAAITAGFEALETDVLLFADADGSTGVESLRRVLEPVATGSADLAVGSRRHPEAAVADSQSHVRGGLGDVFAWLGRRALPVSLYDYQCGAKAIDAEAWARIRGDVYEPGFGWDVDVVAAAGAANLRVAEVPITWSDHPESTVDPLRTSLSLGGALFRVARRSRRSSGTDRPVIDRLAETD